jgi:predicted nucleotidyltransferase
MSRLRIAIPTSEIARFCARWGVQELAVFGSAIREDFGPDSDIDLLVELDPSRRLGMYEWVEMIDELRTIFGREVDLIEKGAIRNPFRRREMLKDFVVIHAA